MSVINFRSKENKKPSIQETTDFLKEMILENKDYITPLKTNADKTAILVDKSDKELYDWAKNG
ncbi:hypothetical protein [Enterococcus casseliflavus]|uniref:hypothetical protein n=1 Tax=Enterococcus casseliflavus TaxID=37734 RepID=UPI002953EAA1|nr:hypothetical protein [Enterococcus casseliflavus]MDV7751165.1 hypothetical protein [Enterococcus casseliflavus]